MRSGFTHNYAERYVELFTVTQCSDDYKVHKLHQGDISLVEFICMYTLYSSHARWGYRRRLGSVLVVVVCLFSV